MKIKEGFIKRKVVGKWVVVPTEKLSKQYNGIIELNDTAFHRCLELDVCPGDL